MRARPSVNVVHGRRSPHGLLSALHVTNRLDKAFFPILFSSEKILNSDTIFREFFKKYDVTNFWYKV